MNGMQAAEHVALAAQAAAAKRAVAAEATYQHALDAAAARRDHIVSGLYADADSIGYQHLRSAILGEASRIRARVAALLAEGVE